MHRIICTATLIEGLLEISRIDSGQQEHVRRAIPSGVQVFRVADLDPINHKLNINNYIEHLECLADKFSRSRENAIRLANENQEWAVELAAYCKKFRRVVPKRAKPFILDARSLAVGEKIARSQQKYKVKTADYFADWAEYTAWLETTDFAAAWRDRRTIGRDFGYTATNGNKFYPSYHRGLPVMLRLSTDGEEVETSMGARVSIEAARILWARLIAGKDVKGHKIGYYTVISFNGELQIGCHKIPRAEINLLAKTLGWVGQLNDKT